MEATTTTAKNDNTEQQQPISKDEVDFVVVANNNNNYNYNYDSNIKQTSSNCSENVPKSSTVLKQVPNKETLPLNATPTSKSKKKSADTAAEEKKKYSTKERLSLFSFGKKISQKTANANVTPTATANGASKEKSASASSTPPLTEKPQLERPTSLPCEPIKVPIGTPPRQHKFVKSSSIARLLGNTYNAKKFEKEEQKRLVNDTKFNTFGGRRRTNGPYLERFKRWSKEEGDVASCHAVGAATASAGITLTTDSRDLFSGSRSELVSLEHFQQDRHEDLGAKAFRTISRGLGKLWWRRTHSVDISTPDPEFKVSYLGNVLTGWAKGEGCVEKQLNTLWRNYTQNNKPDVIMRVKVCASGLKATTRQHGLTEYWSNRITHCCAPKNFPRVFCWIYRHEGRKLKHELRCHAVLCSKEKIVQDICNTLKENLECALREFKREKILKQNARLSLANAAYDNPSLPRRKILLSVGGNNYRPPLERSKSAPKLMAIEEAIGEEEGDEVEETNEPEMKSCCQKDSLYPAMTLGRRRCRRGHSIRRTGQARPAFCVPYIAKKCSDRAHDCCSATKDAKEAKAVAGADIDVDVGQRNSYGSDESDDFEKLLKYNNYDSSASLANELMPYFDMKLHKNTSSSLGSLNELKDDEEPLSLILPTINSDPSADPDAEFAPNISPDLDEDEPVITGLRQNGVCSDGEEDYLDAEDMYFRQAAILNMLHRNSMRKMANLSLSSDESSIETNASLQYRHQMQSSISSNASSTATSASAQEVGGPAAGTAEQRKQINPDSDEGSISSGCETSSTVTANQDDISLNYRQSKLPNLYMALDDIDQVHSEHGLLDEEPITAEEIYQRLESRLQRRHNSDATTFSSSSSITLKLGSSPTTSVNEHEGGTLSTSTTSTRSWCTRRQRVQRAGDSDSECSDESGYVEFQERDKSARGNEAGMAQLKPQPPPKPMPRRLLTTNSTTTTTV